MSKFTVVVAGAGLGGLALAHGLRRRGIDVVVYERDSAVDTRRQGYRLHLDAAARRALHQVLPASLCALFDATTGTPKPRFTVLDTELGERFAQDSAEPAYAVDRLTLRRILLTGIDDRVVFGKAVVGFRTEGDRIDVRLADGDSVRADILVGADGINSVVRRQYLPHARIVDTGVRQLYGAIALNARTRNLFDDSMFGIFTMIAGPDRNFVGVAPVEFPEDPATAAARLVPAANLPSVPDYMTCSFGARAEWFGAVETSLRDLDGGRLKDLVSAAVRTWHPRIRAIVDACDPAGMFALPLRTSVPIPAWPTTPITLLGDAVHAMSPAAGSGACVALRDAADLAETLESVVAGKDRRSALHEYEQRLIDYGFTAVRTGAADGHRFLGQNPLPA